MGFNWLEGTNKQTEHWKMSNDSLMREDFLCTWSIELVVKRQIDSDKQKWGSVGRSTIKQDISSFALCLSLFIHSSCQRRNVCFVSGNASLISEALRHYQRLENETNRERLVEKSSRKSEKQHRRPYQIKECKIRPIIVQQAVTHKIKVGGSLLLSQSDRSFFF